MAINKTSEESVLYGAIVPLLGIGLCVPLARSGSMRAAFVLGLTGAVALALTVAIVTLIAPRMPRNIRLGLSAFTGAGITILCDMAAALLPWSGNAPVSSVVPFVIMAAVLIADAPLPEPRKKMSLSLVEALFTGLGFAALLCILGGLRGLIEKNTAAASGTAVLNPVRFFASVPGALFLIALLALVAGSILTRRKGVAQ